MRQLGRRAALVVKRHRIRRICSGSPFSALAAIPLLPHIRCPKGSRAKPASRSGRSWLTAKNAMAGTGDLDPRSRRCARTIGSFVRCRSRRQRSCRCRLDFVTIGLVALSLTGADRAAVVTTENLKLAMLATPCGGPVARNAGAAPRGAGLQAPKRLPKSRACLSHRSANPTRPQPKLQKTQSSYRLVAELIAAKPQGNTVLISTLSTEYPAWPDRHATTCRTTLAHWYM